MGLFGKEMSRLSHQEANNPKQPNILITFLFLFYVHVCVCKHTQQMCTCRSSRGQGTTWGSWFSSFAMWVLGIKLRSLGLAAGTFTWKSQAQVQTFMLLYRHRRRALSLLSTQGIITFSPLWSCCFHQSREFCGCKTWVARTWEPLFRKDIWAGYWEHLLQAVHS